MTIESTENSEQLDTGQPVTQILVPLSDVTDRIYFLEQIGQGIARLDDGREIPYSINATPAGLSIHIWIETEQRRCYRLSLRPLLEQAIQNSLVPDGQ